MLRMLDLPAPRALQVALEQGLQLHQQRELLPSAELLAGQVPGHLDRLSHRWGHVYLSGRTWGGSLNWISSRATVRSSKLTVPRPSSARTTPSTSCSGADAPAVRPTRWTPARRSGGMSPPSSTSRAGQPARSATSTSRLELDELAEPTTSTRSHSAASARTAS